MKPRSNSLGLLAGVALAVTVIFSATHLDRDAEPELGKWQPFTSEDIDFKGGRDDVRRLARQPTFNTDLKLPLRFRRSHKV